MKPRFVESALAAKEDFRNTLGGWFDRVGKDYPWRRTADPYRILVSEMMLQQTQVTTVLRKNYYDRFLGKFPDVTSLSRADDESLLKAWEGLGYYRRARMLRETARSVIRDHGGIFPEDEGALLALPGIGPYTAAALMAFAFGKNSALVDGNVSLVLSRLMDDASPVDATPTIRKHRGWAAQLCDPVDPARHHHAMMELGQQICRPGRAVCEKCPVAGFCECADPAVLPVKKPRAIVTQVAEHAIWTRDSEGRVLLHLESGSRRAGLWKLPLRPAERCSNLPKIYEATYPITRYRVFLQVFQADTTMSSAVEPGDEWIPEDRLHSLPVAAPFRKAIRRLLAEF